MAISSMLSSACLKLALASAIFQPCAALAAELPADSPSPVKRFGLSLMAGFFSGGQLSYRLPVLDDRVDVFVTAAPLVIANYRAGETPHQGLFLGGRYFFAQDGLFRPYVAGELGSSFQLPGNGFAGQIGTIATMAGLGTDLMLLPNLGLTLTAWSSLTALGFSPEAGIKFVF